MFNKIKFIILLCSFLLSSVPLKNKLLVPIYFDFGLSFGYNDNIFKFSDDEKERFSSYDYMGSASTYDSSILKPDLKVFYSPQLFYDKVTNFVLFSSLSQYPNTEDKNNIYYSLRFEYKVKPYSWIKLGYKNSTDNFLRYYTDGDLPENNYKCDYDSETVYANYSINFYPYGWTRFEVSKNTQFFNPYFTEFDLEVFELSLTHNDKYNSYNISAKLSNSVADNVSYKNGLNSTEFDRSYNSMGVKLSVKRSLESFLNQINFGYEYKHRSYVSESELDALHAGRSHVEISFFIFILKELLYDIDMELRYKFRYRKTNSDFEWVESLKSFKDNQIVIKFTYDMELDLFY